jgi:hypothetical protein
MQNLPVYATANGSFLKAFGGSQPKANLGLLAALTMRRARRVQSHFCGTSAQAYSEEPGGGGPRWRRQSEPVKSKEDCKPQEKQSAEPNYQAAGGPDPL